ncbi:MAG: LacI family DNA-binding transcriptional regulator [Blastocatellia bacterium]|nr:LacI family DNA-binding transcriptional regulator [Blastocatellia bacterium]
MAYTMKDVAERAGVSLATVSHVLNKTRYTAPETESRVLAAVEDLNYHANAHARRLAMKQTDLFGLIVSEIANPFFPEIINGFQTAAWKEGFDTLLCNTEHDPMRSNNAIRNMLQSSVRGVAVMSSALDRKAVEHLKSSQIGAVFYNLGPAEKLISNIQIDYLTGISQSIDHLIELGHREIAVISGPQTNRTAVTLQRAIVDELEKRGLRYFPILESNFKVDGGASAVRALMDQSSIPTAIFCGNDLIAMGAMSALEEAGVNVPEDVSIVGFDDIFFARLSRPPLTTVRIPRERLGELAFKALHKMSLSKRQMGIDYQIGTELVIRKSTARPRKQFP